MSEQLIFKGVPQDSKDQRLPDMFNGHSLYRYMHLLQRPEENANKYRNASKQW